MILQRLMGGKKQFFGDGFNFDQSQADSAGEFGVKAEHFRRVSDFVRDVLPRSVSGGKQSKIGDHIPASVPVDVMDGLIGQQQTSEVLLHNVSVFKEFPGPIAISSRHHDAPISVFVLVARNLLVRIVRLVGQGAKLRPAFCAAQSFLAIDGSARTSLDRHEFAALNARHLPLLVREFFRLSSAEGGAIERVTVPLLSDCRGYAGFHLKRVSALFTHKGEHWDNGGGSAVNGLVSVHTGAFAKFTPTVSWLNPKVFVAVLARQLNRHSNFLSLNKMDTAMSGFTSQGVI